MVHESSHPLRKQTPIRGVKAGVPRRRKGRTRRGISALWFVLSVPIFLILLAVVLNIANLWLARVELENAMEAAALAAVKEWGDAGGGSTVTPREVGQTYARANLIRCRQVDVTTNLDPSPAVNNPNANLTCCVGKCPPEGNLIFGAITEDDPNFPVTFNAGVAGGCIPATVFIEIYKPEAGAGDPTEANARTLGIFFDEGPASFSIRSVSFTLPALVPLVQRPYFDGSKDVLVSIDAGVTANEQNRFNPDPPRDVRGIDPDPISTGPNSWICTSPPPPVTNPNGDICFGLSDEITCGPCSDRYRTLTINFKDGAFTSTNDPNTTDFVRFGASINQMNPPALPPGTKNDGEAWHIGPVSVTVTFYDSDSGTTRTVSGVFVDDGDPNNGRAIATLGGAGGEGRPAVVAQAVVPVPNLLSNLFCIGCGPHWVSAKVIAEYDCETGDTRLVRVDRLICPGP